MYNPSIPALSYVDIPNYKTLKANAQIIPKASDVAVTKYEATIGQEGLQYDQSMGRANLMKEREAAMTVADYSSGNFISNDPHQSELRYRLLKTLKFSYPNIIYEAVIADARTLPKILFLEQLVSSYYSRVIMNNIINIYTYSPSFYAKVIYASDINFKLYERFIYLLTLIQIVLDNKDQQDFMEKDERMKDVVEWCLTRKIQDINYLLQGPTSNQEYSIDYSLMYHSLISPSSSKASVADYLTLATLQEVNANFLKYREEFVKKPNVYDKNPNYAQSYTISIDTRQNAKFKYDNVGNLVVDCNDIDLGSSTNDNVDLEINNAIVNTESLKYEPKSQPTKFGNLLHQFSIFRIKSLLILKSTYKTALRNYDTCYITFPNITLDGRFNQVYKNGALQVAGRFKENNNNKYWEFEPFNDVVYIPKTANVKRFEFYVSPKPGSSNKPNPNNFKIATEINKYYNIPIRVHSNEELDKTPLAPTADLLPETYIIRSYKINKKGNPSSLKYTFLYNRTMKTIQVLPGQMDISNTPKFGIKKRMKSQQIHTGMMKPEYPSTRVVIYEAIKAAIFNSKSTFRLPRIVPLTDLKTLEYLMAQARLKGEKTIKFKTDIRAYRFQIPDIILSRDLSLNSLNSSENSKSKALDNWIEHIIQTIGHIPNPNSISENSVLTFKDEIINRVNDALVNNKNVIYITEDLAVEEFKLDETNPYILLKRINTKEYDFSNAMNIKISVIDQIFTNDYITSKINDAISKQYPTVYINGEHYKYFELYFEDGSSFEYDELPSSDYKPLFEALKNHKTTFTSNTLKSNSQTKDEKLRLYIKYISNNKIRSQMSEISEKYVEEQILNNVDSDGNILNRISILGNTYSAYSLSTKEYVSDEVVKRNKNRIQNLEKYYDCSLSISPPIIQRYFIEYYGEEIKQKIMNDIANTQTGKIEINGKEYQYVYFNDENKDLIFDSLQNNKLYYSLPNSDTRITITLYSKEILIDSAKIYYYQPSNEQLSIPKNNSGNSFIHNGKTYYFNFNTSEITENLNSIKSTDYDDNEIQSDCINSIRNYTPKINGIEWLKLAPESSSNNTNIQDVMHDMVESGNINRDDFYSNLINTQKYTLRNGRTVQLSVMKPVRIRYEMSKDTGNLWDYAVELEGILSDEYEQAKLTYDSYIKSDNTNIIDTSIPLPDILPTDSNDEIYKKWSNYYSYYGLFIPDFNYILDYESVKPSTAQIYKGKDIVDADYNIYDWLIPLYNVGSDGTETRTTKRINAVVVENIGIDSEGKAVRNNIPVYKKQIEIVNNENKITYVEDTEIKIDKLLIEDYEFRNDLILHNYEIDENPGENESKIKIRSTTNSDLKYNLYIIPHNENGKNYYQFDLSLDDDNINIITFNTKNILLPSNTRFNYSEKNNHQILELGVDSTIQLNSIKINDNTIEQIENPDKTIITEEQRMKNIENFINKLYITTINGTYIGEPIRKYDSINDRYIDGIPLEDVKLSSENFQEYNITTNGNSDVINISYDIETIQYNPDNTTTTYHTSMEVEYPNNLTSLNDMSSSPSFTNYICYRNFDITKNIYKTFIIEDDLMATNVDKSTGKPKKYSFSTDNWLYSIKKLMYSTSKTSPYIDVHDLKLKMLTNSVRKADYAQYMQPVLIKYFIQWINNYDIHLIINEHDYGFSDVSAFINDNEYKLQVITDNLFSLDYKEIIDNTLEIYSSGSRFKMLIQLL